MTYTSIATLAQDAEFLHRSSACYATETMNGPGAVVDPVSWVQARSWHLAAQPGFGDAYAYAVDQGNPHPGSDPAVITDAMILSAVQSLITPAAPIV
jgi:hypothetical protein